MQRLFLSLAVLVVGAATLVAQEIPFRIDPSTDFSRFKTYKWVHTDHESYPVDPKIIEATDAELARKGLKKTDSDVADAFLCYHSYFGTEKFYRYHSEGEGSPTGPYVFTIQTGEVAIDMYDSSSKKLIWRNTADINPKAKPKHITKAVSKLLKNYPPKKV